MLLLIVNGDVFTPAPNGRISVLIANDRIVHIGSLDAAAIQASGAVVHLLDATGWLVVPGLVLPRTYLDEPTPPPGVTTVVATSPARHARSPHHLLNRLQQLRGEGFGAFLWSGGNGASPITTSLRNDILLIDEVIGIGESLLSDLRAPELAALDLARTATEGHLAALETGKAGLLHLAVGSGKRRMARLFEAIRSFDVEPGWFYPSITSLTPELLQEAAELTQRGTPADLTTPTDEDLLRMREAGADLALTTISGSSPLATIRALVAGGASSVEEALALATSNPARILKLAHCGEIAPGKRADVLLLDRQTLELKQTIRAGKLLEPG